MIQTNSAVQLIKGEDVVICHEDETRWILAIADGHGGAAVANTCSTLLPKMVIEFTKNVLPSEEEFQRIFEKLHEQCKNMYSGAALTLCVLDKITLAVGCANVGDVGCIIATPSSYAWLSTTHRLQDNAQERKRLHCGVQHATLAGPPRLWPGGLSCGRTLGDADCPSASCVPSVAYATLDKFSVLIIASDGIVDATTPRRIADVARQTRCATSVLRIKSQYNDDASVIVASTQPTNPYVRFSNWLFKSGSSSSSDDDDSGHGKKHMVRVSLR